MTEPRTAPYGSWRSPITTDLIVSESLRLAEPTVVGDTVYWLEGRPAEGGRTVLVRRNPAGAVEDVTPRPFNVRSRAHEYGGGAWAVHGHRVWFVHYDDQCVYEIDGDGEPRCLTRAGGRRYADLLPDVARERLIGVCENHEGDGEAETTLVAIDLRDGTVTTLASGYDFYSTPALAPDGRRLAWLSWRHPDMPWDSTELWCADLDETGRPVDATLVAGGGDESVFQPAWSPGGTLVFASDRSGWWNLYAAGSGTPTPLAPAQADYGMGQWVFGMRTFGFVSDTEMLAASTADGVWRVERVDLNGSGARAVELPHQSIEHLHATDGAAVLLAGAPDKPMAVVRLGADGGTDTLVSATKATVPADVLSRPRPVSFPTTEGDTAHALYYPPRNDAYTAPASEQPPLLVMCHGGPTSATSSSLDLRIQYWTSRGIAVLDVNYRGSTGYGRAAGAARRGPSRCCPGH